jgi:hypothetical protein
VSRAVLGPVNIVLQIVLVGSVQLARRESDKICGRVASTDGIIDASRKLGWEVPSTPVYAIFYEPMV